MEQLKPKEQLGLYRDDGLGVVELPGPESERLRKNIINLFFKHNLRITPEATIKTTDLLDVQFCLKSGVYKPFKKDSSLPLYVLFLSNHPGYDKKEIPSDLSSSEDIFLSESPLYIQAFGVAGYKEYEPKGDNRKQRKRNAV